MIAKGIEKFDAVVCSMYLHLEPKKTLNFCKEILVQMVYSFSCSNEFNLKALMVMFLIAICFLSL